MGYLPLNMDVKDRPCLVVGGGKVGRRKVDLLLEYGALVRLVSRDLAPDISRLVETGRIVHLDYDYQTEHLDGVALVFAATNDQGLNARVAREARERNLPVNVADQPEHCTFIVPASLKRGDLVISVSTSGRSPALAARIKARLEEQFGVEYQSFLYLMGLVRQKVLAQGRPAQDNRRLFLQLVDSPLLFHLAQGDLKAADDLLTDLLGPEFNLTALGFVNPPEAEA
ncbi:MAG: bifunctional precorrin-2 dehydrogenase/sirohydrochlorin ferrochelatase [Pseudomonadota bacterium]